jgi:hypothetical protein
VIRYGACNYIVLALTRSRVIKTKLTTKLATLKALNCVAMDLGAKGSPAQLIYRIFVEPGVVRAWQSPKHNCCTVYRGTSAGGTEQVRFRLWFLRTWHVVFSSNRCANQSRMYRSSRRAVEQCRRRGFAGSLESGFKSKGTTRTRCRIRPGPDSACVDPTDPRPAGQAACRPVTLPCERNWPFDDPTGCYKNTRPDPKTPSLLLRSHFFARGVKVEAKYSQVGAPPIRPPAALEYGLVASPLYCSGRYKIQIV